MRAALVVVMLAGSAFAQDGGKAACRPLAKSDVAKLLSTPWCGRSEGASWRLVFDGDGRLEVEVTRGEHTERSTLTWRTFYEKIEVRRGGKLVTHAWCQGPSVEGLETTACR